MGLAIRRGCAVATDRISAEKAKSCDLITSYYRETVRKIRVKQVFQLERDHPATQAIFDFEKTN